MTRKKQNWYACLWIVPGMALLILVIPVVLIVYVWQKIYGLVLFVLWNYWHGKNGRQFLVVFSNSPKWHGYFVEKIVPLIGEQGLIVNTTRDNKWSSSTSVGRRAHKHWGGTEEHTPIVIYFPRVGHVQVFRFYKAFKDRDSGGSLGKILDHITELVGKISPNAIHRNAKLPFHSDLCISTVGWAR